VSHTIALSRHELEKLSLRAVVVYATKCARRMQRMYDLPPNTPGWPDLITVVDKAITTAEQYSTKVLERPPSQYQVRYEYYEVITFAEQTAKAAQKAAFVTSGAARDAASIAAILVKVVANILNVFVEEDPNVDQIYNEAIQNHSWDIAQDIVAQETAHTWPSRVAEAEARRRALAIEATSEIIRIASIHIDKDLFISDYQSVMEHLQN